MHWYGGNEQTARHLGELTAGGAAQAELLGHEMDGPVDMFVYDAREDFFGALGPGAREWFGAATFPPSRTIFMWLGAGRRLPRDHGRPRGHARRLQRFDRERIPSARQVAE